jgi:hypothetical protein
MSDTKKDTGLKVVEKKVETKTKIEKPDNSHAMKIIKKFSTRIAKVVLSPRKADGSIKEWKRYPWSTSFLHDLKPGRYGLRFLDKSGKYLASVTYTK